MNLIIKIGCVLFFVLAVFSCRHHDNTPSKISQLQGNWIIDSIVVYENKEQAGFGYKLENTTGTIDFRTDNRMYSDYTLPINLGTDHVNDTSNYSLVAEKNLILINAIDQGVPSSLNDSLSIGLLTDSHLVFSQLNQSPMDWYPKTFLHKK